MARRLGFVALAALVALAGWASVAQAQDDRPRRTLNVTLHDEGCPAGPDRFCVTPEAVTLEGGADLVLNVKNEGRVPHNLTFANQTPEPLANHGMNGTLDANETKRLVIPWPAVESSLEEAGRVNATLECGRDGHAALGERFRIHVPSLAAEEENPQPAPGALAALAVLGVAALIRARKKA